MNCDICAGEHLLGSQVYGATLCNLCRVNLELTTYRHAGLVARVQALKDDMEVRFNATGRRRYVRINNLLEVILFLLGDD